MADSWIAKVSVPPLLTEAAQPPNIQMARAQGRASKILLRIIEFPYPQKLRQTSRVAPIQITWPSPHVSRPVFTQSSEFVGCAAIRASRERSPSKSGVGIYTALFMPSPAIAPGFYVV
ncbi:hypothetical protein [Pseudomonas versuta]|uniref:hypothetical protein n=1 Tax=Pseudomonas versuta TaxID=1788301 RepID=UPI00209B8623|nr:hypothetical protein [Pseudomonas versuta]